MSVSGSNVQGYFLTDGLGSVANVTDASGNAAVSYTYDVYGAIRSQSGSSANYWGFTGEQRDAESGFTYLRERYYDVETGRFLSQDPLGGGYPYASNNPVNRTDPTGLCDCLYYNYALGEWRPGAEQDAIIEVWVNNGGPPWDTIAWQSAAALLTDPDTGAPVDPGSIYIDWEAGIALNTETGAVHQYSDNPGWHKTRGFNPLCDNFSFGSICSAGSGGGGGGGGGGGLGNLRPLPRSVERSLPKRALEDFKTSYDAKPASHFDVGVLNGEIVIYRKGTGIIFERTGLTVDQFLAELLP